MVNCINKQTWGFLFYNEKMPHQLFTTLNGMHNKFRSLVNVENLFYFDFENEIEDKFKKLINFMRKTEWLLVCVKQMERDNIPVSENQKAFVESINDFFNLEFWEKENTLIEVNLKLKEETTWTSILPYAEKFYQEIQEFKHQCIEEIQKLEKSFKLAEWSNKKDQMRLNNFENSVFDKLKQIYGKNLVKVETFDFSQPGNEKKTILNPDFENAVPYDKDLKKMEKDFQKFHSFAKEVTQQVVEGKLKMTDKKHEETFDESKEKLSELISKFDKKLKNLKYNKNGTTLLEVKELADLVSIEINKFLTDYPYIVPESVQ